MTRGRFGKYGGQYAPEVLMPALEELEKVFESAKDDPSFQNQLQNLSASFSGRPTPLYFAQRLTEYCGGAKIYFKREDLAHTGAHKINNALGQALLVKRMDKNRVVAETGAGQHGVATAAVCAMMGLECVVYMGSEDMMRQQPNVFRMKLMGAQVCPVNTGSATLKDAVNEAFRDWASNVRTTYYLLGSALGPHPYPTMVREFQSIIGKEARAQILEAEKRLPDLLIACVGGGSNAIGLFFPFINDPVSLLGVEAGGLGIESGKHAARFAQPKPGTLHGSNTYVLQDHDGQILNTHSVSAGLDYAAIGPEHSQLYDSRRAQYTFATDEEALQAFEIFSRLEGIMPALESSHAIAQAIKSARKMKPQQVVVVNLSGRGDKDLQTVLNWHHGKVRE